jgi:hypothetical protein
MSGYAGLRELTEQEREELMQWAQSRTLSAGDVFRARLMLVLADGHRSATEVNTPRAMTSRS